MTKPEPQIIEKLGRDWFWRQGTGHWDGIWNGPYYSKADAARAVATWRRLQHLKQTIIKK